MVPRVGGCIQLLLQLLYFPFPMLIIEGIVAINGNGNEKQKQKKKQQGERSKQAPLNLKG